MIPDVPAKLEDRKKKEARLVTELMIKRETERAVNEAQKDQN